MSPHTVTLGNPYRGGDSLNFLNSRDSEPSVTMQEGALRVLQGMARDGGPKPERAPSSDNIRKVSEAADKACLTGDEVPAHLPVGSL